MKLVIYTDIITTLLIFVKYICLTSGTKKHAIATVKVSFKLTSSNNNGITVPNIIKKNGHEQGLLFLKPPLALRQQVTQAVQRPNSNHGIPIVGHARGDFTKVEADDFSTGLH